MHPVLFKIGFLTIYSYGLMLAIAFITATFLSSFKVKKAGLNHEIIFDLSFWVLIFGIIGARILYILTYFKDYIKNPLEIIMINRGGLIFYGGFISGVITGILFLRKKNLDILQYMDLITPAIPLAHAIGRIGCFLNGCCFGKPTNLPWGIVFPKESYASALYHNQLLHPTQLYEILINLIIFIFLATRKFSKPSGKIFFQYVILYSVTRFLGEILRGDNKENLILGFLSLSQLISIFLLIITFAIIIILRWKNKKNLK